MKQSGIARVILSVLTLAVALPPLATGHAYAAAPAPLIVIDPGHGGPYSNANANGLREETVNLQIALELRNQLQARGYRVAMTRTTDRAVTLADIPTWNWSAGSGKWYHRRDGHRGIYNGIPRDDLQARCNLPNRLGADLFISIHNNGSGSRAARGTETIASSKDPLGVALSRIVHRRIVARTGLTDRGVKQMDLYVCGWTNAPSILVEGAFITNPSDAYKLKQSSFRRKIAIGIAEGVKTWFASGPYDPVLARTSAQSAAQAAVSVSRSSFPTSATVAVVARSDRWADAPAAPALAASLGGPLFWANASGVSSQTADELGRLAPQRVITLGLNGSFDESATATIASSLPPGSIVESITAASRSALSVEIARAMGPSSSDEIMLADQADTGAMLTAASAGARSSTPLILVSGGRLSEEAAQLVSEFAPSTAVLLGTPAAVPSRTVVGVPATRLDGADFSARANAVNARYYRSTGAGSLRPVVADFRYGPEYLTAAAFAARRGQPLIPVAGRVFPTYTRYWITNRRPQIATFTVFDARSTIPVLTDHMLLKADRP